MCFNTSNRRLNPCCKNINFEMRKVLATIIFPMMPRLRLSHCFIVLIKSLWSITQFKSISHAALDPLKCTPNIFYSIPFLTPSYLTWKPIRWLPPSQIPLHFVALIWRHENFENWLTRDKALVAWSGLLTKRVTSSAYCWIFTTWSVFLIQGRVILEISELCLIFMANSSTPRINNNGEKGQPCLTPHSVGNHSDSHPAHCAELLWPLLLTWFNFNPSMDK